MVILPSNIFAHTISNLTKDAYAIHWGVGSWYNNKELIIIKYLKRNNFIRKILGKKPYILDYIIKNGIEKYLSIWGKKNGT
jgi:hypothetical protein